MGFGRSAREVSKDASRPYYYNATEANEGSGGGASEVALTLTVRKKEVGTRFGRRTTTEVDVEVCCAIGRVVGDVPDDGGGGTTSSRTIAGDGVSVSPPREDRSNDGRKRRWKGSVASVGGQSGGAFGGPFLMKQRRRRGWEVMCRVPCRSAITT